MIWDHPIRGEGPKRFSWRIRRVSTSITSRLISGCRVKRAKTFGPCQETSFSPITSEPRVKLYSPREESFHIPLKYIDVARTTRTNLDVKQERRIDDYWNIDGSRDLSDSCTGYTQFTILSEKPPEGKKWSGWRLTRKAANIQARSFMARTLEKIGKKC